MTYEEARDRVDKGERFEDPDILRLVGTYGWTIAHMQILSGWTTKDPNILKLTGKNGVTIAHIQALQGRTTLDPYILSLTTGGGVTVLDVMLLEGWKPKTEEEKLIVFTVKAGA